VTVSVAAAESARAGGVVLLGIGLNMKMHHIIHRYGAWSSSELAYEQLACLFITEQTIMYNRGSLLNSHILQHVPVLTSAVQ
jgi:hypothetical protein